MNAPGKDDFAIFISTQPAGRGDRRLALAVATASVAVFFAAAAFAKLPLAQVPAFVPVYESWLVILGLITAVLLFGQFAMVRERSLYLLACGYLFTAFTAVAHALSLPGVFSPTGLLGAGPQSTWLVMFRHAGFPLLVVAYALVKGRRGRLFGWSPGVEVLAGIAGVALAVSALTLLATAGANALPAIMEGDRYTAAMIAVVSTVWGLGVVALLVLWRVRPHTVLDLWLMVVMCAWVFDIALSAVLNAGRFDLGFYAGRIYGLLAAGLVLVVMLLENGTLYAKLVQARESERRERRLVEEKSIELAALNKELEAFSHTVSQDLRTPLRVVDGYATMIEEDHGQQLDANARRLLTVLRASAQQMAQMIEDLLAFSRLGRGRPTTQRVPLEELVRGVIAELPMSYADRAIEFTVGGLGVADADPALLKQAFTNLIGNSVKYTRGRFPAQVEIGCSPPESPGNATVYYVKDNGAGFDMRQSHRLFGVFQRFHSPQEFEGTGVGLAMVERIVRRHGGRIWAESRPNEGAVFYFTLEPDPDKEAGQQSAAA
jgi:signal transduction histidine kinase